MSAEAPTYYNINPLNENGMQSLGDIVKAIYNLTQAIVAICEKLDADSGTIGTDYGADVSDDLATAMTNLQTPTGGTT